MLMRAGKTQDSQQTARGSQRQAAEGTIASPRFFANKRTIIFLPVRHPDRLLFFVHRPQRCLFDREVEARKFGCAARSSAKLRAVLIKDDDTDQVAWKEWPKECYQITRQYFWGH